mgnify:CR=1 FL=1
MPVGPVGNGSIAGQVLDLAASQAAQLLAAESLQAGAAEWSHLFATPAGDDAPALGHFIAGVFCVFEFAQILHGAVFKAVSFKTFFVVFIGFGFKGLNQFVFALVVVRGEQGFTVRDEVEYAHAGNPFVPQRLSHR